MIQQSAVAQKRSTKYTETAHTTKNNCLSVRFVC